jgi:hypothetical protein
MLTLLKVVPTTRVYPTCKHQKVPGIEGGGEKHSGDNMFPYLRISKAITCFKIKHNCP